MAQLTNHVNLIRLEVKKPTVQQDELSTVMISFLPKQYQKDVATLSRSKPFMGAIALRAGHTLILRDSLKEAACTAVCTFNLCDDTSSLSKDVEDILHTQEEIPAILQRVQSANNEKIFRLGKYVRATQVIVKKLSDAVKDRLHI